MSNSDAETHWALKVARKITATDLSAKLFGVIVYTDRHIHIKQMLRNDDYWRGLESASGKRWSVFVAMAAQGSNAGDHEALSRTQDVLVNVWREPSDNLQLIEAFGIRDTRSLPMLVVYSELENGEVLCTHVRIPREVDAAYEELAQIMELVDRSLAGMDGEFRALDGRAFNVVEQAIQNRQTIHFLKRSFAFLAWLKSQIF